MVETIKQSIRTSIQALLANKGRSFLTMLGIIIGVGAVIALMSIGAGAQAEITGEISSIGTNLLVVLPGERSSVGASSGSGDLTMKDVAALADPVRLAVVDGLWASDRSPAELQRRLGVASNLLAHHLDVLEREELIERSRSSGETSALRSRSRAGARERHEDAVRVGCVRREGVAERNNLRLEEGSQIFNLSIERVGRGEDYLVWRFTEVVLRRYAENAEVALRDHDPLHAQGRQARARHDVSDMHDPG